jgi:histone demethylase JARID1
MKIPRDAARPKLEDLVALAEEMMGLPFQADEEEVLQRIISNAQGFRDNIARYCNPIVSTEAETETQRFYLRKLEGAEVLLAYETNFFRQELHKWCPVAPEAPPILEVSLSTRKPRPTKLQKMLVEYGVENPDDLPEHAKGKANSLRRKAANAEAAAAAAAATNGPLVPPSGSGSYGPTFFSHGPGSTTDRSPSPDPDDGSDGDRVGPRLVSHESLSNLEERLLEGKIDDIDLQTELGKSKALEILGRTEEGRKQAEKIWGADVWSGKPGSMAAHDSHVEEKPDDEKVEQMFNEMTNQEEDEGGKAKGDKSSKDHVTADSLESERNDLDAMIDGE